MNLFLHVSKESLLSCNSDKLNPWYIHSLVLRIEAWVLIRNSRWCRWQISSKDYMAFVIFFFIVYNGKRRLYMMSICWKRQFIAMQNHSDLCKERGRGASRLCTCTPHNPHNCVYSASKLQFCCALWSSLYWQIQSGIVIFARLPEAFNAENMRFLAKLLYFWTRPL